MHHFSNDSLDHRVLTLALLSCFAWGCGDAAPVAPRTAPTVDALAGVCAGEFDVSPRDLRAKFSANADGTALIMRGSIGRSTLRDLSDALNEHPDANILILPYSPGSSDDVVNLQAARLVADSNLGTCVPDGGSISSGAVDLFLGGRVRRLLGTNTVGGHTWAQGRTAGVDLPRDDPEHDLYLDYYAYVGVDPEFYWFTLEAAPANDIHNMTEEERLRFEMETPPLEPVSSN